MNSKIKLGQIEKWDVDRVIPYDKNAKLHPETHVKRISASIEEFTFLDPIAVDEDGIILEGHGRLKAALEQGMSEVPVIQITGLTDAQKVAYRLAHNKLTMITGFDPDMLKLDFEFLQGEGFDLDLTGFGELELSFLNEQEEEEKPEGEGKGGEDDYEQPEEIISRVKLGEIWQLGRHFICCGDSTIESNVKALLGDRFGDVGMVWADPPYGINVVSDNKMVGYGVKGQYGKAADNGVYAPVIGDSTIDTAVKSFQLCTIFNGSQVWWGANYFSSKLPNSKSWIVWDKENAENFADGELAWCKSSQPVRIFKHMWNGMIKASEHGEKRVHPTQKPVALCEWAFEKYGDSDDLIFDPFLGSGISIIAAQKMEGDRTVYGFELSPDYCEVIIQRFEKFTGIEAKLIGAL